MRDKRPFWGEQKAIQVKPQWMKYDRSWSFIQQLSPLVYCTFWSWYIVLYCYRYFFQTATLVSFYYFHVVCLFGLLNMPWLTPYAEWYTEKRRQRRPAYDTLGYEPMSLWHYKLNCGASCNQFGRNKSKLDNNGA